MARKWIRKINSSGLGIVEEVSNRQVPVVPLDAEQSIWEKRLVGC